MGEQNDIRQAARQALATSKLSYSIELYEKLLDQTNNTPIVEDVINYGAILRKTGQLNKASRHYINNLPKFSDNIQLIQNSCNCWIELKEFEQSRIVLRRALDKNNNDPTLLLTLGYTELSAGNIEKACKIFEKILQEDSKHFEALFNLAVTKAKGGALHEALTYFRQANQLQNNNQKLNANIISILIDLNRIEEAWKELRKLNPRIRSSQEIKSVEVLLLMAEENYTKASNLLQEITESNPSNPKLARLEHMLEGDEIHSCTRKNSKNRTALASREY